MLSAIARIHAFTLRRPPLSWYNAYSFKHMALIAPFRALRYDPARVRLQDVVTQPYDKITPSLQTGYYEASPYNLVRIILGRREPEDASPDAIYTRAASSFQEWRRQGVFLQDSQPSIYTYSQTFEAPGSHQRHERRGFIALGKLEDYAAGIIFRHEQTLAKPKADRLNLLRATRAHFGQLFMLYSDAGEIDSLLTSPAPPDIDLEDDNHVQHRVWRISDPSLIDLVRAKMRDQQLVIADGHHRYETALAYRNERAAANATHVHAGVPRQKSTGNVMLREREVEAAPYEMVMMTFVNRNSPGLVILPTHRVVHGITSFSADEFALKASAYFRVEEVDATVDAARATAILREASRASGAMLAVSASRAILLHSCKAMSSPVFSGYSFRQQMLDIVQLHRCLLEGALGLSEESIRNQENISYVRSTEEALTRVREGGANVAFLMNPCRMDQVRDIALAGEVLPQKSTDFYPKLLSGLTIYALD